MPKINLRYWQWLLIVGILIYFVNLDAIYVNLMEVRNMVTAREMVHLNHWFLTTLNNIPRYEKPPLPTWITAVFGLVFGFKSLIIMRLPAAIMSLITIWMVYKFALLLKLAKKQAFISALIMAGTFYLIFSGRTNQWDVYTHAFMLVSIYYLFKYLTSSQYTTKNIILSALFFGLSFMSKGPVSLYALWLPFIISFGIVYRYKQGKINWRSVLSFLLIGFGIGLWWFVYVRLADYQTFHQIMARESSRWGDYNVRPFYYYWDFFIQSGVWTILGFVSLLYWYLKDRVSNKKAYRLVLLWTLFSVILLSCIPEKKARYLLPTLIPFALNIGFYIDYLFRTFRQMDFKESLIVYVNHFIIAIVGIAFPFAGYFILDLHGEFWWYYGISSLCLFTLGWAMIYFIIKKNYPKVFYLTIAFICAIMSFAFPLNSALLENPKLHNIKELRTFSDHRQFEVYEYGSFAPQLIWDYGKPIEQIDFSNPKLPEDKVFGIIFKEDFSDCIDSLIKGKYKIIAKKRYDNNYVSPKKRGYKNWLVRKFYLLKKK